MLTLSVQHAKKLEKEYFKYKISITHNLTSDGLSILHKIGGRLVYLVIIGIGIGFAIFGLL